MLSTLWVSCDLTIICVLFASCLIRTSKAVSAYIQDKACFGIVCGTLWSTFCMCCLQTQWCCGSAGEDLSLRCGAYVVPSTALLGPPPLLPRSADFFHQMASMAYGQHLVSYIAAFLNLLHTSQYCPASWLHTNRICVRHDLLSVH